ncbi:MAG: hypothetical protein KGZ33_04330, partial [Alkaliphilus sp.]|nr:hypothetical protein [Alkaliphilus sp.]
MKIDFIDLEIKDLHNVIINVLHRIKYNQEKSIEWMYNVDVSNIDKYSKNQFRNLCIMATFIQVAFNKKNEDPPKWVLDSRLCMKRAYRNEYVEPIDIFDAYQAEYNHNVFYPKSS